MAKDEAREDMPEGFTLTMALVDAVPVVLFCLSCIALGRRIGSASFVAGAALAFAGGTLKVGWKLAMALLHKNVPFLSRQMRYTMPLGFLLMIAGVVDAVVQGRLDPACAWAAATSMPSALLFLAWVACMGAMGYFAGHLDGLDARANWLEQGTNALGQACLLAGVLLLP